MAERGASGPAGFGPETAAQIEATLDAMNDSFGDSFAYVARAVGDDDSIESALLVSIDPQGVQAEVTAGPEGTRTLRVDFDEPVAGLPDLGRAMLGLVRRARALRPDEPLTSFEKRIDQAENQSTHHCRVRAVRDLSPQLRALTIGPLDGWNDLGGDEAVSLLIELPGRPIPDTVRLADIRAMDAEARPKAATYSVRRYDRSADTIEVWVVLHSAEAGTISGWARTAETDTPITVWGPRRATAAPEGVTRFVGVCDETGIAATLAMADELPDDVPVDLVVEVDGPAAEFSLGDRRGVTVHWHHRGGAAPGTGTLLTDGVRGVVPEAVEGLFVFGAAESRCISSVRRYLRRELELPASMVSLTGYWRSKPNDK
ncbi:MAG: SIP domain-containing protein [Actinomycetota bacterium]